MSTSREVALYKFIFGKEYDEEYYNSVEEAAEEKVTSNYGDSYDCDGGTYLVVTDSEAEDYAVESIKSLIDDIGAFGFSDMATTQIKNVYLDDTWFSAAQEEILRDQWDEEFGDMDEDDEDYVDVEDYVNDNTEHDSVQWYEDMFGEDELKDAAKRNDLVDEDGFADWCISVDGIAHTLAGYDGEEHEQDGWNIYRTN